METKNTWPEGKCPIESQIVACDSCGSEHFSVEAGPRQGKKVPGICDECGFRMGRNISLDSKSPKSRFSR